MNLSNAFIIIKGQPKSQAIDHIRYDGNGYYKIKYKSSYKYYSYKSSNVVCLTESVRHDPSHCRVSVEGRQIQNLTDIHSFPNGDQVHWRITYKNGHSQDYLDGALVVEESCLSDQTSKDVFEYLKNISQTNGLGKSETDDGILFSLYKKIDFIDKSLVAAPYINPQRYKIRKSKAPSLIFPFGCNASQLEAVTSAFENQISVIQGPPGTGKTQTILNIIANILVQGKTVLVVSNNNSATTNVLEKLRKDGLDFVVAALGKRDNKEDFIEHQPSVPEQISRYELDIKQLRQKQGDVSSLLSDLTAIFSFQEELALAKQELKSIELEQAHFVQEHPIGENIIADRIAKSASQILKLWIRYQNFTEKDKGNRQNWWDRAKRYFHWKRLCRCGKRVLGRELSENVQDISSIITDLQHCYYVKKTHEITLRIKELDRRLASSNAKKSIASLSSLSMDVLWHFLSQKFSSNKVIHFSNVSELRKYPSKVLERYPVVLSTTFSARTSISDTVTYDYLIMDEASQVSIETGALAMTCAKNAVIVGDTFQLPNVVTQEDKLKLDAIFQKYHIAKGYNCSEYSFLQSICSIIPDVKQTLLREHYRCHPKIINFCNQKFYGGNLLIMTEDNGDQNAMSAIKTVPGHHCRGFYNQREIDVVKQEVLPQLKPNEDVGIITPYNQQVNQYQKQIPSVEAATIHKYQGREKDVIILSVVDDQISEFSDDSNLINVAVSRAKKKFCIVLSGNEQALKGNISELVEYIQYHNFSVSASKVCSIFDYLYSQYTSQRISMLSRKKRISEFDSENLTYQLLSDILKEHPEFNHLGVVCHIPLRNVIRDTSLMNATEIKYATHPNTHLDFLILNHVTKKPLLAIETDGYRFHNEQTEQHQRDILKDHILTVYGLPILRLSTNGSGEKESVISELRNMI